MSQFPDPIQSAIKNPSFSFPHALAGFSLELHGAVSHEGHLDVVCALIPRSQTILWFLFDTEGLGGCGEGKEINLLILFMSNQ